MQRHVFFCLNKNLQKKWKDQKCRSFQIRVLERGHTQRKQKNEKENTCGRNEKTRREKRDNRWTDGWTKEDTKRTQRGNACMWKG